ncbi:exonuclease V [Mycena crocata]|nr:exonuclease V [Mycena crocata]
MSDDSYEEYNDFADLTEEDFMLLEAPLAQLLATSSLPQNHGGSALPAICIEVEAPSTPAGVQNLATAENAVEEQMPLSPMRRYRRRSILSVTDLISLAWCEVQFDYGLRQKRSRKLADRPPSFRGDSGKEIVVQKNVAARNDKTTKRGQFIHKELELALRPEEIKIVIAGEEERWAMRLITLISSLTSLGAEGCAREIPVFGLANDVVVVGMIDELLLVDEPGPEIGTKRFSDSSLPSPKRPCRTPSPPCESALFPDPPTLMSTPPTQCIRVIDTKTRRTSSLPSDEDAEPARLQLMLYHRLLTTLLQTSPGPQFDFASLWASQRLDPFASFSDKFLKQTTDILGVASAPKTLTEMVLLWRTAVAGLGLPAVGETLQIVYRSQKKYYKRRMDIKRKNRVPNNEEEELAKAIAMSLADTFDTDLANALHQSALESAVLTSIPINSESELGTSQEVGMSSVMEPVAEYSGATPMLNNNLETTENVLAEQQRIEVEPITSGVSEPDPVSPASIPKETDTEPDIIGTKEFPMDPWLLDAYLNNALQWWKGERKAQGVSVRQTGRCFSCEYCNDCEWREQKAEEMGLQAQTKAQARKTRQPDSTAS